MEHWYIFAFIGVILVIGTTIAIRTNWRLTIAWLVYIGDQIASMVFDYFYVYVPFWGMLIIKIAMIYFLFQITFIEENEKHWPKWPILALALELIAFLSLPLYFAVSPAASILTVGLLSSVAVLNLLVATVLNFFAKSKPPK